jgi:DNA polymerase-1
LSWQDKIRDKKCKLCPLYKSADHVCLMGTGPKKAEIMIVGEAPGAREDETHQAFVGPAGQLLRQELQRAGIDPEECYITNVVKCRPPDNRTPELAELKMCGSTYLSQEIAKVRPRWILLLGNSALRGVVAKSGITKHRGSTYELGNSCTAFAAFHPAYAIRNPRHLEPLRADLQRFGRMVRGQAHTSTKTQSYLIDSKRKLKVLKQRLMAAKEIAFDIETSYDHELKRYHKPWDKGAAIVSIAFSFEEGSGYFVPLWHAESPWCDKWQEILTFLKPTLQRKGLKYIAHNGKFDTRWLARFGVFNLLTFDTMLAAHILDENRRKALEELASILFGAGRWKMDLKNAHTEPIKRLCRYNCTDTDMTLRLYHRFKRELMENPRLGRIFVKLMMPANHVLTKVESLGMYMHPGRHASTQRDALRKREEARTELLGYVPEYNRNNINFNSTQQVAHWLFTELELKPVKKTKSGKAWSTDESVLLQLAKKHPAPKALLAYREWKGHAEKLAAWADAADEKSRVHTNYNIWGTVTGRLSSSEPNLQQVPREGIMRTVFGAPKGWYFMEADYSQIELRVIAMLSGDPTLRRVYLTGGDAHTKTASEISGVAPQLLTKEQRKKAKPVNFGFAYGMGEGKFVDYARDNYDVHYSPEEAAAVRRRFFSTYARLPAWHERQRRLARRYGHVSSPIGRVRHLPDIYSSDRGVAGEAERQAINSPVQSFASDLMLMSLVLLDRRFRPDTARIVGTVHDALLFEVRKRALEEVAPVIRETMEDMSPLMDWFGCEVDVPIKVEITYGKYWGDPEAKEWT